MRKFKLIKKLPFEGSPDIGYISIEKLGENGAHYWNHNWFHPENYPEFWQEMVEKDYEILIYRSKTNSWIFIDDPKDFGRLKLSDWEIYSILRKSDGVEFNIGDRVYNPKCKSQNFTITNFYLDCNKENLLCGPGHINITKIEHYKEILLTTEDGYVYFKDAGKALSNWIYCFNPITLETRIVTLNGLFYCGKLHPEVLGCKFFKEEDNRTKYIEYNKPKFSKQQLLDIIEGNEELSDGEVIEEIYKLINK